MSRLQRKALPRKYCSFQRWSNTYKMAVFSEFMCISNKVYSVYILTQQFQLVCVVYERTRSKFYA